MKINPLHHLLIIATLVIFACSCSKTNNDKATELLKLAKTQCEKGEFNTALNTLNELDSLYPREFDIRKQARHLRPQIVEQLTLKQISDNDSLMALEKWLGDSLAASLRLVKNPVENYYVIKDEPADINSRPGIYARMSPDATLYLTVVTNGVKANAIEINNIQTETLPFDNYRVAEASNKNYALTFMQAEVDSCLNSLTKTSYNIKVRLLNNGRGVGELKLTETDIKNILKVYENALSVQRIKLLTIKREHLEQTLATARSQIARTSADTIPN